MEAHPTTEFTELDRICVDSVRVLPMDAVQKANSGHPGTPMALAPLAHVLWTRATRMHGRCHLRKVNLAVVALKQWAGRPATARPRSSAG
jgi:hypothetical protein